MQIEVIDPSKISVEDKKDVTLVGETNERDNFPTVLINEKVYLEKPTKYIFGDSKDAELLAPTFSQMREVIYKETGNLTNCTQAMGWHQMCKGEFYRWIKMNNLTADLAMARDTLVDKAEEVIKSNLNVADTNSAMFVLKTQGRYRGWNEKDENAKSNDVYNTVILQTDGSSLNTSNMSDYDLAEFINKTLKANA
jgi:hypothetical protein